MVDMIVKKLVEEGKDQLKKLIDEGAERAIQTFDEKVLKRTKSNSIGKVVVVGLAGHGKSNLINSILGKNVAASMGIQGGSQGVTKVITEYNETLSNGMKIRIYDTPGIGDCDVKLDQLKEQFEKFFSNKNITAFLFVKNIDEHRVDSSEFCSIEICESCVASGNNALQHMIVVFTHVDRLDEPEKADEKAKQIIYQYNEKVRKTNKIDKYVLYNKKNPEEAVQKIITHLKQFEYKLHIGNNFLAEMASNILKQYKYDVNCFSSRTKLIRKTQNNNEEIFIEDINCGDIIKVGHNLYEKVLTKSVHNDNLFCVKRISVQQEHTSQIFTIEVTPSHMMRIFNINKEIIIPANKVKYEDIILLDVNDNISRGKVIKIEDSFTKSVVNVRTYSGSIICNNILTTSYIQEDLGRFGNTVLRIADEIKEGLPQSINSLACKLYGSFNRMIHTIKY